ncbi:alpha/beta fold hydrolase [Catenulispora rubra]|uniref:alpha/beta fold hydrolase n=1 Tax=Catenulispora rubra TaxID=280293 RepID=UPI001891F474|nr:alpha/beta fold hydrolase [Catenulispora rubra]
MNDIEELKQFVVAHAKAQQVPEERYRTVLDRIHDDGDGADGSWAGEWIRAGAALESEGGFLEATSCYNMGRFPFVDNAARRRSLESCVNSFARWAGTVPGAERFEVSPPGGGTVGCWASGLTDPARPLVIILGGIVSVKEQWGPLLPLAERLGMAMVVTEMPGVGENSVAYGPESWRMFPAILEAVRGRCDTDRVYAAALSFSGHLALRWAAEDPRVRGIVTIGAPVSEFFTDRDWFGGLPRVTVDTLVHLIGAPAEKLVDTFLDQQWMVGPQALGRLDIPLYYTASLRDEIIPPGEVGFLRENARRLSLTEYDDVHGSPEHSEEIRGWVFNSLLEMR